MTRDRATDPLPAVEGAGGDPTAARVRRFLDTMLATTRAIAGAPDTPTLLADACTALVGHGAFILAWVGADEDGDGWMERLAVAGDTAGYTDGIRISVEDVPEGRGPTGLAARTREAFISEDVANDPRLVPWRDRQLSHGIRASAAFPIPSASEPTAVLTVYAGVVGAFGADEAAVLTDVAAAIAFALDAFATARARAAADAALAASDERYRELIEELDVAVFVRDLPSGEVWASNQVESVVGYPVEQVATPGFWRTLVVEDDRERMIAVWDSDAELDGYEAEYRVRRADGRVIWIEERWRSVRAADGRILRWYGVAADVTERKRLEEAVARTQRLEAVARLASAAAHDFGNILQGISIIQEFLAASIPPGDPRHADVLQIRAAVDQGTALTRELLAFGREEPETKAGTLDVAGLVRGLEPMLARVAGPGIALVVEADGPAHATIARSALEQTVLNLVINARDAMAGGGSIVVSVRVADIAAAPAAGLDVPSGAYAVVSVADDGCGMSPEVVERAIEPFFTTKELGTGIGLSSVYGAARRSGGTMRIDSEAGRGTTVEVLLPLATA